MNVDRILALADLIEQQPHTEIEDDNGFNMSDYTHDCGTPACIAGWAVHLSGQKPKNGFTIHEEAAKFLGISTEQADNLFIWARKSLESVTPNEAAATLRNLAATGEVEWAGRDA